MFAFMHFTRSTLTTTNIYTQRTTAVKKVQKKFCYFSLFNSISLYFVCAQHIYSISLVERWAAVTVECVLCAFIFLIFLKSLSFNLFDNIFCVYVFAFKHAFVRVTHLFTCSIRQIRVCVETICHFLFRSHFVLI